jgi:hypothetical protein
VAGCLLACSAVLAPVSCGGERQDKNEPEGRYRVEVLQATFPIQQKLAKRSKLVIVVRNADSKTIPNVGVTVNGFELRERDPDLADPNRPIFVINGRPKRIGGFPEEQEAAPENCDTAYVNTWACGPLRAGREKSFVWDVTAVKAGPYRLSYRVNAGLDGKSKAVDVDGGPPTGLFVGTISDKPPASRVADDGRTIIRGTR